MILSKIRKTCRKIKKQIDAPNSIKFENKLAKPIGKFRSRKICRSLAIFLHKFWNLNGWGKADWLLDLFAGIGVSLKQLLIFYELFNK